MGCEVLAADDIARGPSADMLMQPEPWTVVDAVRGGLAMVRLEPVHPAGTTKNGRSRASGATRIADAGTRPGRWRETRFAVLAPLVALLCTLVVSPMAGHASGSAQSLPAVLVEWESGESAERLSSSSHKADFFPLSNHFISQDNSVFCGPVSSAIVLNALRLGRKDGLPKDRQSIAEDEMAWLWEGPDPFYGKYTPNNVLNEETKTRLEVLGKPILIKSEAMSDFGLQLSQLAQVLRSHGLKVETRIVDDDADADAIGHEIAANLASGDDYMLVNYARRPLDWRAAATSPRSGRTTKRAIRS